VSERERDIVERLRKVAHVFDADNWVQAVLKDAADEIERLRAAPPAGETQEPVARIAIYDHEGVRLSEWVDCSEQDIPVGDYALVHLQQSEPVHPEQES